MLSSKACLGEVGGNLRIWEELKQVHQIMMRMEVTTMVAGARILILLWSKACLEEVGGHLQKMALHLGFLN